MGGNSKGTVLITGATKNTGLATAKRFAREGYNVAITSRSAASAEKAARSLALEYGVKAIGYAMQMNDVADIKRIFSAVNSDFGGLTVLVCNAAHLGIDYSILNSNEQMYSEVMDVNIRGNFFCCQCAAEIMKNKHKGAIVVIGSVHRGQVVQDRALYTISKGALLSMVKSMAIELGIYGIRANYIAAGAIHTERWDEIDSKTVASKRAAYPIGRESMPEEIAEAVYFLGSELSPTVTGTELVIDSGVTDCLLPFSPPKDYYTRRINNENNRC